MWDENGFRAGMITNWCLELIRLVPLEIRGSVLISILIHEFAYTYPYIGNFFQEDFHEQRSAVSDIASGAEPEWLWIQYFAVYG
jgi:hypothetical protein